MSGTAEEEEGLDSRGPVVEFDTSLLPPVRRFRAFKDFATPALGPEYHVSDPENFSCRFGLALLGGVTGFDVSACALGGDGLTADMTPAYKKLEDDTLVIHFCKKGRISVRLDGEDVVANPGEIILAPMRNGAVHYTDDTRFAAVLVTKSRLGSDGRSGWIERPSVAGKGQPAASLLHHWLTATKTAAAARDAAVIGTFERVTLDLIQLLMPLPVEERAHVVQTSARVARLQSIFQDIATSATLPGYSAAHAAKKIGVSERYIRMLLEETGKSFSEHVLEARLMRAHTLLRDPNAAKMRVSGIALTAGFSDVSYFNRVFRLRFGDTPLAVRTQKKR